MGDKNEDIKVLHRADIDNNATHWDVHGIVG